MISNNSNDEEAKYYGLDLDGDYESTFKKGWRPDPFGEAVIPVGLCPSMCTTEEMYERQTQRRLSRFEIKPNTDPPMVDMHLAVKEFRRSAAGIEYNKALNLRPWSVLKRTLNHLLLNICKRQDDWMYICDFVFDRMKAVRQDMIIQRIEGSRYIEVLEGSVRFLVYSMYRLTCTLKDYTMVEPMKVILTPDGTPLSGLDNYEMNVVREMKLTMQCLKDCLQSLIVQYQDYVPDSPNRALFEAVNLIVNIPISQDHQFCQTDFLKKREYRNGSHVLKAVFKMYLEHLSGNHLAALNNLPKLRDHPLIIIAYAPVVALLQIHLMHVLIKAHASRGPSKTSPDNLCRILCPDWLDFSYDERLIYTIFMALQYGIINNEDLIDFSSGTQLKQKPQPRDFRERIRMNRMAQDVEGESETRVYAMQLIAARNWSFFIETLKIHGVESILDPSRQYD